MDSRSAREGTNTQHGSPWYMCMGRHYTTNNYNRRFTHSIVAQKL
jgi:hypothetical protein